MKIEHFLAMEVLEAYWEKTKKINVYVYEHICNLNKISHQVDMRKSKYPFLGIIALNNKFSCHTRDGEMLPLYSSYSIPPKYDPSSEYDALFRFIVHAMSFNFYMKTSHSHVAKQGRYPRQHREDNLKKYTPNMHSIINYTQDLLPETYEKLLSPYILDIRHMSKVLGKEAKI